MGKWLFVLANLLTLSAIATAESNRPVLPTLSIRFLGLDDLAEELTVESQDAFKNISEQLQKDANAALTRVDCKHFAKTIARARIKFYEVFANDIRSKDNTMLLSSAQRLLKDPSFYLQLSLGDQDYLFLQDGDKYGRITHEEQFNNLKNWVETNKTLLLGQLEDRKADAFQVDRVKASLTYAINNVESDENFDNNQFLTIFAVANAYKIANEEINSNIK